MRRYVNQTEPNRPKPNPLTSWGGCKSYPVRSITGVDWATGQLLKRKLLDWKTELRELRCSTRRGRASARSRI